MNAEATQATEHADAVVERADELDRKIEAAPGVAPSFSELTAYGRTNRIMIFVAAAVVTAIAIALAFLGSSALRRANERADGKDRALSVVIEDIQALRTQLLATGETPVVAAPTPEAIASAGERGPQGDIGPVGPAPTPEAVSAALRGLCGDCRGDRGEPGVDGATGTQGDIGPVGPAGAIGPTGPAGASIQGEPGPAGQSITGPAGADGQSITGPQGPAGVDGASIQGPSGPAGADGAPGAVGPPGPAPASFTFTIGAETFVCTQTVDPLVLACQPQGVIP